MPVPNLSEHAMSRIAFNRWQLRGNTHRPSSCGPKYHFETTSGVMSVNRMWPNTDFRCSTSVRRLRFAAPVNVVPSGLRCVSTYQSASSSNLMVEARAFRSRSVGCTHFCTPRRCRLTSSSSPLSQASASSVVRKERCTRREGSKGHAYRASHATTLPSARLLAITVPKRRLLSASTRVSFQGFHLERQPRIPGNDAPELEPIRETGRLPRLFFQFGFVFVRLLPI